MSHSGAGAGVWPSGSASPMDSSLEGKPSLGRARAAVVKEVTPCGFHRFGDSRWVVAVRCEVMLGRLSGHTSNDTEGSVVPTALQGS